MMYSGENIDLELMGVEVPFPLEVIAGFIGLLIFGLILGAIIYLPIADKHSPLSIERLSNDVIWRYFPDWILMVIGCIICIVVSFLLVGGMWRM